MPVKRAGQILGESDTRMWRMLFAHVKAAYERLSFDNVVWVGADEMNRRLRTSNMCERINREIKRRTRVAGLFPNESSVLRLLTAILMETSDEWETGRAYFSAHPQP
jgi:transposase-like protein